MRGVLLEILYVDDEEGMRKQAKIYLERLDDDFEVSTAPSTEDGLQELEENDYDVIISDYKMSPKSGIDFLEEVRASGQDIPFIIFTGKGREEVAMKALNLGADRYIRKGGEAEVRYEFLANAVKQEYQHYSTTKEKELQETYFQELFEKSPEGIVLVDSDDKIIEVNEGFEKIFQYNKEEVIGKRINEVIVPSGKDSESESVSEVVLSGNEVEMETVRERKDGSKVHVSLLGYPIELKGELIGVFAIYRDITERKRREETLKRNEKKYRTIFKSANDAMFILKDHEVSDCNEKAIEMFGYPEKEFIGKHPSDFAPEKQFDGRDSDEKADEKIEEALEDEPQSFEWIHQKADGTNFHTEVMLNKYVVNGETSVMAVVRDISEIRKMKKRLEDRNKKITELHKRATKLEKCKDEKEVCELVVETAEEILDFEVCGVDFVREGRFIPIAVSSEIEGGFKERKVEESGISKKAYQENKSLLIEDRREVDYSKPVVSDYRASITIPLGDFGIFQALSVEVGAFDEDDKKIAEILVNHATEAINRLRFEEALLEKSKKIKSLHRTAVEMERCTEIDEVYDLTIEAAEEVLGFYDCTIAIADEENNELIIKRALRGEYEENYRVPIDHGYLGKTYENKSSYLIDNLLGDEISEPTTDEYRSAISIPIGDIGVFQTMSTEVGYYDDSDVEMAETLISHTYESFKRLQSEKELRRSEKRYRAIFENTGTAMIMINEDDNITLSNEKAERLLGLFEESLVNKDFLDFVVEEDEDRLKNYHDEILNHPENIPREYNAQLLTKQEDVKDIHLVVSKIPGREKLVVSLIDITEKKEFQKARNRLKSLIHEIEADFERLETYVGMLDESDIDESQRETMEKMESIIKKNKRLLRDE